MWGFMIRLSRKSRYFDKLRNYKIFIDNNNYYYDIGNGEVKIMVGGV